jgi:hypothetical protein
MRYRFIRGTDCKMTGGRDVDVFVCETKRLNTQHPLVSVRSNVVCKSFENPSIDRTDHFTAHNT